VIKTYIVEGSGTASRNFKCVFGLHLSKWSSGLYVKEDRRNPNQDLKDTDDESHGLSKRARANFSAFYQVMMICKVHLEGHEGTQDKMSRSLIKMRKIWMMTTNLMTGM